jgi:hypothetical protein
MPQMIDITGHRYGRLTVVERAGRNAGNYILWRCRCDCGGETLATSNPLRMGGIASCGCLYAETRMGALRHGQARGGRGGVNRTPAYRSWRAMLDRCYQPTVAGYQYYGGSGITVCDRWREFANFLADMGARPDGMSLDRIDPFGNYEPGNCRWATAHEQSMNTRAQWLKRNQVERVAWA